LAREKEGRRYRIDMRPKTFLSKMKIEVVIFSFALFCAVFFPYKMY